jgi:hypothetical membrane protein
MAYSDRTIAGTLLFAAMVIFIMGLNVAEQLYPGYSVSSNYISDLGATCRGSDCQIVQPSAMIFDSSVILAGLLTLISAHFIRRGFGTRILPFFLALSGIGSICVGIFPEYTGYPHYLAAFLAFAFGGLSVIGACPFVLAPLRYISAFLGIISLLSFALFFLNQDIGLGIGGMERMIAYPFVLAAMGFGGYLMNTGQDHSDDEASQ